MAPTWRWALGGAAGAALALGVGEAMAALIDGGSPISAIGGLVIDLQPPGAKDFMVFLFGTNDKLALEVATAIGAVLVGALLGVLGRRSMLLPRAGVLAFGVLAVLAILRDPLFRNTGALVTVIPALLAGLWTLRLLLPPRGYPGRLTTPAAEPSSVAGEPTSAEAPAPVVGATIARRGFLVLSGVALAVGGLLTLVGRTITARVPAVTGTTEIPAPGQTVPPPPAGADFAIDGLAPIVVPNPDFYRIDTRLTVPRLDAATWSMRIHGLVEREVELTYAELLAMPLAEQYVTLACVSNEVGGYLVGNARWTGTPLVPLLQRAGVKPEATQLVGRSFDGWTAGFPTAHLTGAGANAMVAVAMNGEPLPPEHGFPARLIVPGLYGYVSATKWLTEIWLTRLEDFDAYWVPLGWAKQAPILTQSRIDVPRPGGSVAAGAVTVAGVAWAPTRGIAGVEVRLDGGSWQPAELSVPLTDTAWVQWRTTVEMAAGAHTLTVRATDGTGMTQEERRTPPAPDGARGYHEVRITARA
jgi:DMSO/TMAO reductase YedYZ molybdopterin-dependent catalytic subunit